jgi:hypothetical protein
MSSWYLPGVSIKNSFVCDYPMTVRLCRLARKWLANDDKALLYYSLPSPASSCMSYQFDGIRVKKNCLRLAGQWTSRSVRLHIRSPITRRVYLSIQFCSSVALCVPYNMIIYSTPWVLLFFVSCYVSLNLYNLIQYFDSGSLLR